MTDEKTTNGGAASELSDVLGAGNYGGIDSGAL